MLLTADDESPECGSTRYTSPFSSFSSNLPNSPLNPNIGTLVPLLGTHALLPCSGEYLGGDDVEVCEVSPRTGDKGREVDERAS
jgi:hypothetical protein